MFSYSPGRGAQHAQLLYAGVKPGAVLMTDGYEQYNGIAHDHQLVHLGCWAHVRRGFIKAEDSVPKAARSPDLLATRFVMLIGKLFVAETRSAKWTPERRQRLRARYSARVLATVEHMLAEHLPTVVPSSLLGKALQYMGRQWSKLIRYVENGKWPNPIISVRTPSGRSWSVARADYSLTQSLAPKPAQTSTRSSRPARRTALSHTATLSGCSQSCRSLQPLKTTRRLCHSLRVPLRTSERVLSGGI